MAELGYTIDDYIKPQTENEFAPFVRDVLTTLPDDKAITFTPFDTEAEAKGVLTKIQRAAAGSPISARKTELFEIPAKGIDGRFDKALAGKWVLTVKRAPRKVKTDATAE